MEIAIILFLLALAGKNTPQAQELPPPELLTGDWNALLHSDWFAARSFNGLSGREIAQAADTINKLVEHKDTLRQLLQGDFSALTNSGKNGLFGQAGSMLENLAHIAALAQGTGGLNGLFGNFGKEEGAESPLPAQEETPLAPIANIADAEIICALTRYFAA